MKLSPAETRVLLQSGYRYALSLTHNESRAEDLVQEACSRILKSGGQWHKGYLFTSIRNVFIDECRRNQRVAFTPIDEVDVQEGVTANEELYVGDMELALEQLKPQEREALYLMAVESYTAAEVAEIQGKPRGSILSLVHRAKRKVRDFFKTQQEGS